MHFTDGGGRLVTAGRAGEDYLNVWDAMSGRPSPAPYAPKQPDFGRILAFAFSRDEKRVAVSTSRGVTVRDVASGLPVLDEIQGAWHAVVLAGREGQWLAVSDPSRTEVWDVRLRKRLSSPKLPGVGPRRPFGGHLARLALWDDGRLLAIVDRDEQTVGLWDSWTGVRQSTLFRHGGRVRAVAFTPDGLKVRMVADDWTIHDHPVSTPDLIALARTKVTRSLTPEECQKYLNTPKCPGFK